MFCSFFVQRIGRQILLLNISTCSICWTNMTFLACLDLLGLSYWTSVQTSGIVELASFLFGAWKKEGYKCRRHDLFMALICFTTMYCANILENGACFPPNFEAQQTTHHVVSLGRWSGLSVASNDPFTAVGGLMVSTPPSRVFAGKNLHRCLVAYGPDIQSSYFKLFWWAMSSTFSSLSCNWTDGV